jgi:hypothetical protein
MVVLLGYRVASCGWAPVGIEPQDVGRAIQDPLGV